MELDKNIIDLSFLIKLTHADKEKMKFFIGMHLKTSSGLFGKLMDSYENYSYEEIYSGAHSLKPQCDYMGIVGLKDKLVEIENASRREQKKEAIYALILEAVELNNKGIEELKKFLDQ